MKKFNKKKVLALILLFTGFSIFADNPIIQTKYTADPAPMVYDNTVFLYTTHDEDDATGFKMKNWLLYTSTDMVNWTDHGIIASLSDFTWGNQENGAWAPQCIERNGKFYFYCPIHGNGIGVLVSDSPYGPFHDPLGRRLIDSTHIWDDIDPSPYIDEDGQAYIYWGNPDIYYVKLNNDMISYSGSITKVSSKPKDYQEGPWLYKRNNQYYLAYASTCCPEGIGYAMSNSPEGPWTWKGKIMEPNRLSDGNHPGIIDYKGKSYCFGLNYDLLWLTQSNKQERRSVSVAEIKYNADGTIPIIPFWSKSGVTQLENLNPYIRREAETICWAWQVKSEECSEGGMNIGHIEKGDYIKVKGVDFASGAISFETRVASNTNGGNIEIRLDSESGRLIGNCTVQGTGGWQEWTTQTCSVTPVSGVHDLYFRFTGESGYLLNFNWWRFIESDPPTPVVTPEPNKDPIFSGGPYDTEGGNIYSELPDGITQDVFDFTISCRINLNSADKWSRVFDFGESTDVFMMLTPLAGNTGFPYFCITLTGNQGEQGLNGTAPFPIGTPQFITVTKKDSTAIMYINGVETAINNNITLSPADLGDTKNNYVGRSQWEQDPILNGVVDEFYIFNRALSASEITDLVNPDFQNMGDVNDDNHINIVDALLIAQYYVALPITGTFIKNAADLNCDQVINIVDALLAAQFYVGLINEFC
ncbi:MAG: family 43 glycosylhydrolase [Spirochaetales bacterium]|nr:family 43 glycosylhydrolase [Spirochaetales bacterium]